MRIFGDPNRTKKWLAMAGMKEGEVIESGMLTRQIEKAQRKVEAAQLRRAQAAADLRRRGQRSAQGHLPAAHRAHGRRRSRPTPCAASAPRWSAASSTSTCRRTSATRNGISRASPRPIAKNFATQVDPAQWLKDQPELEEVDAARAHHRRHRCDVRRQGGAHRQRAEGVPIMRHIEKDIMLKVLDQQWRDHLGAMDYLRQGIHLRGYAQKDYRYEYKREAFELFAAMLERIKFDTVTILATLDVQVKIARADRARGRGAPRAPQSRAADAARRSRLAVAARRARASRSRQAAAAGCAQAAPPQMPPQQPQRPCAPRPRSAATSPVPAAAARSSRTATACSKASSRWGQSPFPSKGDRPHEAALRVVAAALFDAAAAC